MLFSSITINSSFLVIIQLRLVTVPNKTAWFKKNHQAAVDNLTHIIWKNNNIKEDEEEKDKKKKKNQKKKKKNPKKKKNCHTSNRYMYVLFYSCCIH
jgi:hypothetical protein